MSAAVLNSRLKMKRQTDSEGMCLLWNDESPAQLCMAQSYVPSVSPRGPAKCWAAGKLRTRTDWHSGATTLQQHDDVSHQQSPTDTQNICTCSIAAVIWSPNSISLFAQELNNLISFQTMHMIICECLCVAHMISIRFFRNKMQLSLHFLFKPLGGKAHHTRWLLMYASGLTASNLRPRQDLPLLCYPPAKTNQSTSTWLTGCKALLIGFSAE